jgi:hypothetical protein
MALEAATSVNWIFWTALTGGSYLVLGGTELAGGTTRGYRLLMAWILAACAGLLLLSELYLTPVDGATAGVRRGLVWGLASLAAAYLVASIAAWPRSAVALAAGLTSVAALISVAAAGGTASAPLFATQLVLAALALGAVNAAMLLGHWYLVTPRLSPEPLRRMMWLLVAALVLQGVVAAVALVTVGSEPVTGEIAWLTWLRMGAGIALPIVVTVLAILASRAPSLQASTGLLYIGLALVMAGSIAGTSITYLTRVPV